MQCQAVWGGRELSVLRYLSVLRDRPLLMSERMRQLFDQVYLKLGILIATKMMITTTLYIVKLVLMTLIFAQGHMAVRNKT